MDTARLRRFGAYGSHAFARVLDRATICEKNALEAGPDGSLGEETSRFLINFDHDRQVKQLDCPTEILECVQVKRCVLSDELNIVENSGMSDNFYNRWPGTVNVSADGRLPGVQHFLQFIPSHDEFP